MDFKKAILFLFVIIVVCSCSSEDDGPDGSFFRDHDWQRTSFLLSQEVDFNQDGIASFEMIDEFDCLSNSIIRNTSNNEFFRKYSILITNTQHTEYSCPEDDLNERTLTFTFPHYGKVKILSDQRVQLDYEEDDCHSARTEVYDFVNGKLTRSFTREHPAYFDEDSGSWVNQSMLITVEYSSIPRIN